MTNGVRCFVETNRKRLINYNSIAKAVTVAKRMEQSRSNAV
ncbi:hypothetical protein AAHH17_16105 [Lysinibacillus capsici]